ncbi:MAG: TIGR01244 family sulfur transferase [Robiginitomaculum sp.]|nr:TIGR01244 family sulfur transferase [Robiginitomaculum sp.]
MQITKINDQFSVSPQIDFSEIKTLADAGYACIINCRPEGEEVSQPLSKALLKAAKKVGLHYHHIPFKPGRATAEDRARFAAALDQSDGPILAFCRSGMRARALHKSITKGPGFFARLFGR